MNRILLPTYMFYFCLENMEWVICTCLDPVCVISMRIFCISTQIIGIVVNRDGGRGDMIPRIILLLGTG